MRNRKLFTLLAVGALCALSAGRLSATPPQPDVVVTKSVDTTSAITGEHVTYTIHVTSNNAPASSVSLSDTLPSGLSFVSANSTKGTCSGTSTVTCSIGNMGNGGTATVTIVATVTAAGGGTVDGNCATATTTDTDSNPSNNTGCSDSISVETPDDSPAALEADREGCTNLSSPFCTGDPDSVATVSNVNRVLEPNETARLDPSWTNNLGTSVGFTGSVANFTGPGDGGGHATYAIADGTADYGTLDAGGTNDCNAATGDCYELSLSLDDPANRPAIHWDATVDETLSTGEGKTWTLHIGNSFTDVPTNSIFNRVIETIFHNGITGGCGDGTTFCPDALTSRAQMATFITVAIAGSGANVPAEEPPGDGSIYNCTDSGGLSQFSDVPPSSTGFCKFINYLKFLKITSGCGNGTTFCPDDLVTRGQMAVFTAAGVEVVLGNTSDPGGSVPRWKQSADLTREYNCTSSDQVDPDTSNTIPANTAPFLDVPASDAAGQICPFVGFLYVNKAVSGDGSGNYLPDSNIKRQETAAIMTGAFSLVLYGP